MPNATPIFTAFNAGPFSELMQGRIDFARMRSSLRGALNTVPTVQGPALARSGYKMFVPVYDEAKKSTLIPFEYADDDGQLMLEFAEDKIRVFTNNGLVVRTARSVSAVADVGGFLQVTVTGHGASVGEQIVLLGFEENNSANGQVARVTAVAGDNITTDFPYLTGGTSVTSAQIARVFSIDTTYKEADLVNLRTLQRNDVLWIFCEGKRNFTLARNGELDWTLAEVEYLDGPYKDKNATGTTLTVTGTGNAIPVMTSLTDPSGTVTVPNGANGWHAADGAVHTTWWETTTDQATSWQYQFAAPTVVDGYAFWIPQDNANSTYLAEDYGARRWRFEGSADGSNWDVLHAVTNYTDWANGRSAFFSFPNTIAYDYYRIVIEKVQVQGNVHPRISHIVMASPDTQSVTITASSVEGINGGQGFLATDVGRLIRIQDDVDLYWRWVKITARNSALEITADVKDCPFSRSGVKTTQWRLGLYSDTTGWPTVGILSNKRLWLAGQTEDNDLIAGSFVDAPFNFSPTDPDGITTDEHAIVVPLDADRRPSVAWLAEDERGLIVGSLAGARVLTAVDNTTAPSQTNSRWRPSVARRAAKIAPLRIDRQVLYVARGKRTLRELTFVFEADGFKSPSMSTYSSHITAKGLEQITYVEEPHSIVYGRLSDGQLVGFTYNRDEDVLAWHPHDVADGGEIEAVAAGYRSDIDEDANWVVIKKTINGQVRRYIARSEPIWRDGLTLSDAFFVDLGLRYSGAATKDIYGLRHLIGETVYCLADSKPAGPFTVDSNGHIELENEASEVVVGIGIHSWVELTRLEAGAPDGTAQGKLKSVGEVMIYLWDSLGIKMGLKDKPNDLVDLKWRGLQTHGFNTAVPLQSGFTQPIQFPHSINREGSIYLEQPASIPLPMNIVAVVPYVETSAI